MTDKKNNIYEKLIVSQKALLFRSSKILLLESAKYRNIWDLPGGRINKDEDERTAFTREIKEEIGISKFESRGVFEYGIFTTINGLRVMVIVNLIENEKDEVVLSEEHNEYRWVREDDLYEYDFFFKEMEDIIRTAFKIK